MGGLARVYASYNADFKVIVMLCELRYTEDVHSKECDVMFAKLWTFFLTDMTSRSADQYQYVYGKYRWTCTIGQTCEIEGIDTVHIQLIEDQK